MQTHKRHIQHICPAQRIPRVHHAIRTKANRRPRITQLAYPRLAASLRVTVMPPLQHDIDQRIRNNANAGLNNKRDKLGHIVVIHRMHRCQMRPCNPPLQSQALRFKGQSFNMSAHRIIAFIAMHIHPQPALSGKLAQYPHRCRAIGHRSFKMRDTTHDIHPHIQSPNGAFKRCGIAQHPILREGNQLQIQITFYPVAHL